MKRTHMVSGGSKESACSFQLTSHACTIGPMTDSNVVMHTDGACSGNPGPGGYGAVLQFGKFRKELSGGFRSTTNNRMELLAVIKGLLTLSRPSNVTVHSDSRYIVDAVNKGWAERWRCNGWQRNKREKAQNPDLWGKLLELLEVHEVEFRWVRGHAGDPGNERADALAVAAAAGDSLAVDEGYDDVGGGSEEPVQTEDLDVVEVELPMLTHVDESGSAQMVDVGAKPDTRREAVARGKVVMKPDTLALIEDNAFEKGDVLGVARVAGIMGGKSTSQLIPLCHPLPLNKVGVEFNLNSDDHAVEITATARTTGKTGVEMEALTAVSVAALTIYDMCKAVDRGMRIESVRLVRKTGGQSGDVVLEDL